MTPLIVEISYRDPLAACARLRDSPMTLVLHGCGDHPLARWSFAMTDPLETCGAHSRASARDFDRARAWIAAHRADRDPAAPPFVGGAAGLISYEMAAAFDAAPVLDCPAGAPPIALGLYERIAAFDHCARRAYIVSWGLPADGAQRIDRARSRARELDRLLCAPEREGRRLGPGGGHVASAAPLGAYADMVGAVVAHARAGDLYQANVARRYEGALARADHPYDLFRRLCEQSPAPYCAYFRLPDAAIVSNSPERFLAARPEDGGVLASTRPIKGTRPRGATPEADAEQARILQESVKDRAENLMIVDLMRNDLSKVCAPGSVRAPTLFGVESFANVHHLVSEVVGRLQGDHTAFDLFAASFPPGSITGAPKLKAMEIISGLERRGRGAYCGSMAWFGLDGAMDASVLIRTALCVARGDHWRVEFSVGAGITVDSDPAEEVRETIAKAASLKRAIEGEVKAEYVR